MVEPSPFTYVCGYMNRYRNTIRFLVEHGCEVLVVSPGKVSYEHISGHMSTCSMIDSIASLESSCLPSQN